MYYVKIDDCGDYLYYPGDPRYTLGDIRLKLALNDAGTLEFSIYGVLACLMGLKEQGCNGPVTDAIHAIEKHINKQAHK